MRTAIIGGGISGLSAAYELSLSHDADWDLFEAGPRLGGVLSSSTVHGCLLEHGPDSFLTEKSAASELCRELGLSDQLIHSNDAERRTYIAIGSRLVPLPDGLMFLIPTKLVPTALTRLFSPAAKLRMARELFLRPYTPQADESIASLMRRHFGQQAVDRLADPLLSGIYGGTAEELSARAILTRMVAMETEHGSLIRGMLHARSKMPSNPNGPRPIFTTLKGGLQQLVDALTRPLPTARIHLNTSVRQIEQVGSLWRIHTADGTADYDRILLAIPAWVAAGLLAPIAPTLSSRLAEIPYTSSITLNLIYDEQKLAPLPPGFGLLIPATEGRSTLAVTFAHRKFPHRAPPGKALLRAFLGARNPALLSEADDTLTARVQHDLRELLGITTAPEYASVHRLPRAMAQYSVGHIERISAIRSEASRLPNLHLIGNYLDGIGIPDCIRHGRTAAQA